MLRIPDNPGASGGGSAPAVFRIRHFPKRTAQRVDRCLGASASACRPNARTADHPYVVDPQCTSRRKDSSLRPPNAQRGLQANPATGCRIDRPEDDCFRHRAPQKLVGAHLKLAELARGGFTGGRE